MPKISAANLADHREHTLNALLDAIDALIVERGDEPLSLSDIAVRAGVARTAIYNYAPDKASLLAAARSRATAGIRAEVATIADSSDRPGADRLQAMLDLLLSELTDSPQNLLRARALHFALSVTEQTSSIAEFNGEIRHHIAETIVQGQRDGSVDAARDAELDSDFIVAVLEVAVSRCLLRPDRAREVGRRAVAFIHRAMDLPV